MINKIYSVIFFLILIVAALFRFYGLNWDQSQHLHPDERFLTLVATSLRWPSTIQKYFDTTHSPLNPHNQGHTFYVYGTWPVILVKGIAEHFNQGDYGNLTMVGRVLSAMADLLTTVLVFFISKRLLNYSVSHSSHSSQVAIQGGLIAMAVYAIMALPIQLAHFYTTDPYATLLVTATLLLLTFPLTPIAGVMTGLIFGLAMAAKISTAPFLLVIFLAIGLNCLKYKNFVQILIYGLLFCLFSYCSLRIFMPYLFADSQLISWHLNPRVINDWKQLKSFDNPNVWFPPSVQWIHTTPFIFPLLNIAFIGLGLPLFIISILAYIYNVRQIKRATFLLLPLATIALFFLFQGGQFSKPMRYFYPLYPALAIIIGIFLVSFVRKKIFALVVFLSLIWPVTFLTIYRRPHSRVTASEWIYNTIPPGSVLTMEHWDDGLPLNLPHHSNGIYKTLELPMYAPDTPEKWQEINSKLNQVDYLILSSNRVYGSITSAPEKLIQTTQFYQDLLAGRLPFTPIAVFASRPGLPIPGLSVCLVPPFLHYGIIDQQFLRCSGLEFVDDYADESWTVYDHPKVIIFKKIK